MSPRGPRPMDDLAAPRSVSSPPGEVVDRDHGSRSPLDRLFRKRYRKRTSSAVPAITVESPVSPCVIFAAHASHLRFSSPLRIPRMQLLLILLLSLISLAQNASIHHFPFQMKLKF